MMIRPRVVLVFCVCAVAAIAPALVVQCDTGQPVTTARAGYLSKMTVDELSAFDRFPVLWLGEEFEGLPLTAIQYRYVPSGEGHGPMERVDLVYGDCEPAADNGCPAPLQVSVYPECGPSVADSVKRERIQVRGVNADRYFTGHLAVETTSNRIVIISAGPAAGADAQSERAANALRGANTIARSLTISDDLSMALAGRARDLAC